MNGSANGTWAGCVGDLDRFYDHFNTVFAPAGSGEWFLLHGCYALLCGAGILGNSLVVAAVIHSEALRCNTCALFIVHLALSDLFLCLFTAPSTLYLTMNNFWPFGTAACRLVACWQAVNTFLSSLTLAAIALDRYLVVLLPTRWRSARMKRRALFVWLAVVWAVSVAIALPYLLASTTVEWTYAPFKRRLARCYGDDTPPLPHICVVMEWQRVPLFSAATYSLTIFALQYFFPLGSLCFVYYSLYRQMRRRARSRLFEHASSLRRRRLAADNRRALWLLSALVATFALCWLPGNVYHTLTSVFRLLRPSNHVSTYCHLAGMTSTLINPVLYGLLNENFRTVYKQMFATARHCGCSQNGMPSGKGAVGETLTMRSEHIRLALLPRKDVCVDAEGNATTVAFPKSALLPEPDAIQLHSD